MGVLKRAKRVSGMSESGEERLPYVCLACQSSYVVQHHSCPVCGCFDLRRSKWVEE